MERLLMIDFAHLAETLITKLADNDVTLQQIASEKGADGKTHTSVVKEIVKKSAVRTVSSELLIDKELLPTDIEITFANEWIDWPLNAKTTRIFFNGIQYNVIRCDNRGYVSDKAVVMRIIARR